MRRWSSFSLALVLAACGPPPRPPVPPPPTDVSATELASVETLAAQPLGVYVVTAYVLSSEACPVCEGHSCARCDPPGVTVLAARYVPGNPAQSPTVLLETLDFRAFDRDARYRFTVRVGRRDGEHLEPVLQLLGAARVP